MAEELKLFGKWASSFNRRVELALKLKGINYDYIEEDLTKGSTSLLEHNSVHKKIPVLVHNGKSTAESLVILEYIDETWKRKGNPILPIDSHNKARARFWAEFVDEKLQPAAFKANMVKEPENEKAIEEFWEMLKVLENKLQGKNFFRGDNVEHLWTLLRWFSPFGIPLKEVVGLQLLFEEKFPMLYKWIQKLSDIDLVNKCLPPREKHLAYNRACFEEALLGAQKS